MLRKDERILEETGNVMFNFQKLSEIKQLIIPVVVQDSLKGTVLMLAYANEEALLTSLKSGRATFWSTSRDELWVKGDKSGNALRLLEVRVNCEQNSLLYLVRPEKEGACHTKEQGVYRMSCYYRRIRQDGKEKLKLTRIKKGGE